LTFCLRGQKKEEQCIYIDYIGIVASGGVVDSVGHISLFANFDFDSPSPPLRNHQNNEIVIIIVIDQISLLAFGRYRPPLTPPHQLCHSLL